MILQRKKHRPNFTCLVFVFLFIFVTNISAQNVYVYAANNTPSFNIYQMDTTSGDLTLVDGQATEGNAFAFAANADNSILYVSLRSGDRVGVSAFDIDLTTGLLTLKNTIDLPIGAVTISVDNTGRYLFTAPYGQPNATISEINEEGELLTPVTQFSTDLNPHYFAVNPTNQFAYIPCLGDDNIHIYQFDPETGISNLEDPVKVDTEPGAGPRFMTFHGTKNFAYVGLELNNTISAYAIDSTDGMLIEINTLSTVPEGYTTGKTAQIHITPDNSYVYISNRGHNSIAGFKIDEQTGGLSMNSDEEIAYAMVDYNPRSFNITPRGNFLISGDNSGGSIVTFAINKDNGQLTEGTTVEMGNQITGILPLIPGYNETTAIHKKTKSIPFPAGINRAGRDLFIRSFSNKMIRLEVRNIQGELVHKQSLAAGDSRLLKLEPGAGMYILNLQQGDVSLTKKIISF